MAVFICVLEILAVAGTLFFTELDNGNTVRITGNITGLTAGNHGFHIHQHGSIENNCLDAGGHFNPAGNKHGRPSSLDRHVGDLGNIHADCHGLAIVNITDSVISFSGVNNINNRSVVVHANEDDLGTGGNPGSVRTGNAGPRVGCCVIKPHCTG